MGRQINAEIGRLPPAVVQAWQEAGPRRVNREFAGKMRELAGKGLLRVEDPERAGVHFSLLTVGEVSNRTYRGALPISADDIRESVVAGVRAFLHGYAA